MGSHTSVQPLTLSCPTLQQTTLKKMQPQASGITLVQGAWLAGSNQYPFGHNSAPSVAVTGAPADANFRRWSMLHDGSDYRLFCFRSSSDCVLYQFAYDGSGYAYGHNSIPTVTL